MEGKNLKKLVKASSIAVEAGIQHVMFSVTADGRYQFSGSDNFVNALLEKEELFTQIRATLLQNVSTGVVSHASFTDLLYDPLPCSPFCAQWKGSARIRKILTKMLATAGYGGRAGRNKQLGVGPAPFGWPAPISWVGFSGATRSHLSIDQITQVIVSMLEAAGYNPATHLRQREVEGEEDNNNDENMKEEVKEDENVNEDGNEDENIHERVDEDDKVDDEVNDNEKIAGETNAIEKIDQFDLADMGKYIRLNNVNIEEDVKGNEKIEEFEKADEQGIL